MAKLSIGEQFRNQLVYCQVCCKPLVVFEMIGYCGRCGKYYDLEWFDEQRIDDGERHIVLRIKPSA